jgi:hypothetical protein
LLNLRTMRSGWLTTVPRCCSPQLKDTRSLSPDLNWDKVIPSKPRRAVAGLKAAPKWRRTEVSISPSGSNDTAGRRNVVALFAPPIGNGTSALATGSRTKPEEGSGWSNE